MVRRGCCGFCAPRYKRLVDSVYPSDPKDGLVKSNMEKLTFYVLSSPEKLDRVGEYLYYKLSRDIYRKRNGCVEIGVEAMDQLLQACHSQTLNLFVESFLKMVQKLLESPDPNLQILATQSFVKFSNIEEDTPSYHRRYDFLVSKFASMAHNNANDEELRSAIRASGVLGLKSVVRKTVSDDLVENIWDPNHMDKIIPSLLFNMEQGRQELIKKDEGDGSGGGEDLVDAPRIAETCLRDLVNKATFGHVRSFVRPVLNHFDTFDLWVPNDFAVHTFRVIMFSIQAQYSYAVIETLMNHLEVNNKSNAKIRASMADVLAKIIDIAAGESVGPSVLEIVNSIVHHIKVSTKVEGAGGDESGYREKLIEALGEYVTHLPDYQKIEIMKFIMQKVPSGPDHSPPHKLLQNLLLKSLLMVGSKYQTTYLSTTFPMSFLQPLLTLSEDDDGELRLLVQNILHALIDRHQNKEKLSSPLLKFEGIHREPCTRTDILFCKKNGGEIFSHLFSSLEKKNNSLKNMNSVFTTLALFTVELFCEETLFEFVRLALSFQELAITSGILSPAQKIQLHVIALSLLGLIAHFLPVLKDYVGKVISSRKEHCIHLLPPLKSKYETYEPCSTFPDTCLLSHSLIIDILKEDGLESGAGAKGGGSYYLVPRHSWVDAHLHNTSSTELNLSVEIESGGSTPVLERKKEEIMTVDDLKRLLNEPPELRKEIETQKRKELSTSFRTIEFEDLVSKAASKNGNLQLKLTEVFSKLNNNQDSKDKSHRLTNGYHNHYNLSTTVANSKIQFPDMFSL